MNPFSRPGGAPDRLTPEQFLEQRTDDAVVIDVRTDAEFASGHVAGAEQINVQAPDFRDRVDALDRDRTYFLYCRSGARSGMAAQIMRDLGFERVYNVGGMEELARAGVDVES